MKVVSRSVYLGPSLHAHFQVIRFTVDLGELDAVEPCCHIGPEVLRTPDLVEELRGDGADRHLAACPVVRPVITMSAPWFNASTMPQPPK